jgi:hypothetical protein
MSSKFRKYLVLAVVAVCSLAIVGQAAATTVTVSPGGAVTGTAGQSKLTLVNTSKVLNCTTSSATATLAGGSTTVTSNLQPAFGGPCTATGGIGIGVTCLATGRLVVTGPTASGSTPGRLSGIDCTVTVTGSTCSVNVRGSVDGSYANPTSSTLTVSNTVQSLAATGSTNGRGSTCASLPNDANARFTDQNGNPLAYAISPAQTVTVTP